MKATSSFYKSLLLNVDVSSLRILSLVSFVAVPCFACTSTTASRQDAAGSTADAIADDKAAGEGADSTNGTPDDVRPGREIPIEEPIAKPSLVTSMQNDYWKIGKVTEGGGDPTIAVNAEATHQQWLGFGGSFNEAGWDVLLLLDEAERMRALRLLFDNADGANFAWGRVPIGASDFAMDRYTLAETPDDFAMKNFSIERDKKLLIPYIKAALDVEPNLRLWASPWSPPAWMKDNNNIDGMVDDVEAHMLKDPKILEAYALYFALFVEQYAAQGLTIEHVEPQNEPGYANHYPSCLWSADLLRDFVRDYLGPTLNKRVPDTQIWFGTMSSEEDTKHIKAVLDDSTARGIVKGFGLQWNTMLSARDLADKGYWVMETEHKCGNYPWAGSFNPDHPPNDYAYGEESWLEIRNWIRAGVHIYSAWNMVLDTKGKNLDKERPWPQNSLLTVDRGSNTLTATPAYWVFRHVSQYVIPGATRVDVIDPKDPSKPDKLDALAFKNPDGSFVVIKHNTGTAAKQETLSVAGTTLQFEIPAKGWATVNWPLPDL
jgi:glucosylceramidase